MKSNKLIRAYRVLPTKFVFSNYLMKKADLNPLQVREAVEVLSELDLIDVEKKSRFTFIRKKPEVSS